MVGGNKKVTHTKRNLQLNAQRSAAGLFKYVWPFYYHQALKWQVTKELEKKCMTKGKINKL